MVIASKFSTCTSDDNHKSSESKFFFFCSCVCVCIALIIFAVGAYLRGFKCSYNPSINAHARHNDALIQLIFTNGFLFDLDALKIISVGIYFGIVIYTTNDYRVKMMSN